MNTQEINDICRGWLEAGFASGKLPQDFLAESYLPARTWIDDYCKSHGGHSKENLDAGLAELNRQWDAQRKFEADKQKLAGDVVRYLDSHNMGSDKSYETAHRWVQSQTKVVLTIQDFENLVNDNQYTGIFHFNISDEELIALIRRSDKKGIALLAKKYGSEPVQRAYETFEKRVHKKADDCRDGDIRWSDSWKVTKKDREAAAAKSQAEQAAKDNDPATIARYQSLAQAVVSNYFHPNHGEKNRVRKEIEDVQVLKEGTNEIDWKSTFQERQRFVDSLEQRQAVSEKAAYYRRLGLQ
jgi:predicted  nucleic acid-binding Zn-ribbon protein